MLHRFVASRLITRPAIWGKLPGHADFVRSGVRHGESDAWESWLGRQRPADREGATVALPAAFVLPPGALGLAGTRFVIGAIAPSKDSLGRPYALLVYQFARLRWLRLHYARGALQAQDWLFWLSRVVGRHVDAQGPASLESLAHGVHRLWRLHAPRLTLGLGGLDVAADNGEERRRQSQRLLDESCGPAPPTELASRLRGVRHFPWADWPECLYRERGEGAFWQQDAHGGYVNAAGWLPALWSEPA